MSEKITLYDLPCKGRCAAWSGNTWRTRLVVNYKAIPYQTEWIEHANIAPTFKELGVEPHSGPGASVVGSLYTVPMIKLPDGTYIMESGAIAKHLEALHPEPTLHLDTGLQDQIVPIMGKIGRPLVPVFMPRVPRDKLLDSPASAQWFRANREKAFGMTLDEMEQTQGGEKGWAAAEPGFEELRGFLVDHKRDEGPFILGSQVSYADFIIVAQLEGFRRIGQDLFERFVSYDERLRTLHKACEDWMKDDQ